MPPRVDILGVGFDRVRAADAVDLIVARVAAGQRSFIVTANPEFVMLARRDPDVAAIARAADLVVADGTGVVVASRLLRDPLPGRVPGRVLVDALLERLVPLEARVFLLGAAPGIAERAAARLQARHPGLRISGAVAGSPDAGDDQSTRARVAAAAPEVLLVAYGMPKQERWIARNAPSLPSVRVVIGVGGVFDQVAGIATVPPRLVHLAGLEWLWRVAREPRRWRRQRVLPMFAFLVLARRARR